MGDGGRACRRLGALGDDIRAERVGGPRRCSRVRKEFLQDLGVPSRIAGIDEIVAGLGEGPVRPLLPLHEIAIGVVGVLQLRSAREVAVRELQYTYDSDGN